MEHAILPEAGVVTAGESVSSSGFTYMYIRSFGRVFNRNGNDRWQPEWRQEKSGLKCRRRSSLFWQGKPGKYVSGKDIIIHIIGKIEWTARFINQWNLRRIGNLSMDDRFTMANMAIEAVRKTGFSGG